MSICISRNIYIYTPTKQIPVISPTLTFACFQHVFTSTGGNTKRAKHLFDWSPSRHVPTGFAGRCAPP